MRILPSGSAALLVELEDLDAVLALHAALSQEPPPGVVDLVPAARTLLVVTDPADPTALSQAESVVRAARPRAGERAGGDLLEVPVVYDGQDLDDVARYLGCSREEVVRRHTGVLWQVAFCGFAPGFGYLTVDAPTADRPTTDTATADTATTDGWHVPRRDTPRTRVPAGSVALAGEYSGVYPSASPGGWQLIGRTDLRMLDLDREPPALLTPGRPVRFRDAGAG